MFFIFSMTVLICLCFYLTMTPFIFSHLAALPQAGSLAYWLWNFETRMRRGREAVRRQELGWIAVIENYFSVGEKYCRFSWDAAICTRKKEKGAFLHPVFHVFQQPNRECAGVTNKEKHSQCCCSPGNKKISQCQRIQPTVITHLSVAPFPAPLRK